MLVQLHSYQLILLTSRCFARKRVEESLNVLARVERGDFVIGEKVLCLNALERVEVRQFAIEDVELGRSLLGVVHVEDRGRTHLRVLLVLFECACPFVTRREELVGVFAVFVSSDPNLFSGFSGGRESGCVYVDGRLKLF